MTPDGQSYNVSQAQQAIGSGGLTGYGFTKGPQTRGGYVPEQETDFIFTVAGEELGFVGAGALVVLLGLMVWRVWRNAQLAGDTLGTLICVGIMSMMLFHRHDARHHARDGHPAAVRLLRRVVDDDLVRRGGPGAVGPHAPLRLTARGTVPSTGPAVGTLGPP